MMLERLDDRSLELRRRIFLSIAAAKEPLTITRELQAICITDFGNRRCDYKRIQPPSREQILASCGSLISVIGDPDDWPTTTEFQRNEDYQQYLRDYKRRPYSIIDDQDDYVIVCPFNQETVRFSHRTVGDFLQMPQSRHSEEARSSLKISSCLFNRSWAERFLASVCGKYFMHRHPTVHLANHRVWFFLVSSDPFEFTSYC